MQFAIDELWISVPDEMRQLFHAAVGGAVQTARTGQTPEGLYQTALDLTAMVGRFQIHFHKLDIPSRLPESITCLEEAPMRMICCVLDVGARSARAASSEKVRDAVEECLDGVSWAYSLARDLNDHNLETNLNDTISSLEADCRSQRLTDRSTIWWAGESWNAAELRTTYADKLRRFFHWN
jgi:hypothetical protein